MDFVTVNYNILNASICIQRTLFVVVVNFSLSYVAGEYTVVASTFEPELLGKFILTVASSVKLQVDAIPSEGAVSFLKQAFFFFFF